MNRLTSSIGIDTYSPMYHPHSREYLWYGIHCIEMIVAWDGVQAALRHPALVATSLSPQYGTTTTSRPFHGVTIAVPFRCGARPGNHVQLVDASASDPPFLAGLLRVVIESLSSGYSDVPADEMLEVVRIIEAANASIESGEAMQV